MPISFQFDVRTFVWIGPAYIGRHFRHALQVRNTSLRRNNYDWGNVCSISVRSFLWCSFDQLAWVAPVDGQLALVAPWPGNGPRVFWI